ncbi:MAG: hypothetical protein ACRDV7_01310, partial [Acidimicrobiia bacterium]
MRDSFDRDATLAGLRLLFDGGGEFDVEIVATRGRAIAVLRLTLRVPSPEAAATALALHRVDRAGRSIEGISFDADDLDAALAEADRMFLETEGAEHAEVIALMASMFDTWTAHDVVGAADLITPDFVTRSHQTWIPDLGSDEWLASLRSAFELFGEQQRGTVRVLHVSDLSSTGGIWSVVSSGEDNNSGPFELALLVAAHVADRRIRALDMFSEGDVEPARAALNRHAEDAFENAATRVMQRFRAAFNARDWDPVENFYADEYAQEDRRSVMRLSLDRDAVIASARVLFDGNGTLDGETVATRGDTISVVRNTLHVQDPEASGTVLNLNRVDRTGRFTASILFDSDDLDTALAEADRMFLETEAAEHADVLALAESLFGALGRHDNDTIGALLAPEFVVRSHRTVRPSARLTASEWLASLDVIGTRSVPRINHIAQLSGDGGVWAVEFRGHLAEGGAFAIPLLMTLRVANGLVVTLDAYDPHDAEGIRAALDSRSVPEVRWFENDATRAAARVDKAFNSRDWDAYIACYADDWTNEDRRGRSVFAAPLDHDQSVAALRLVFEGGGTFEDHEPIATRGRTLALTRMTLRIP